jgi:putative heme iron utilization protein
MTIDGSHAALARALVAAHREGTLSTLARDPAGYPFGSHVLYALVEGRPVFLISNLAEHTKNLENDPRASLLVVEAVPPGTEQLAVGRVTLLGRCARVDRSLAEAAFLVVHPDARGYASFKDFGYWALDVESVRYVGGFGRMSWVDADAFRAAT